MLAFMSDTHLSCSTEELSSALEDAEAICLARNVRLTPIRRRVLELLLASEEPAKAYDLLQNLGKEGAAKPPTIYRALDFLLELGLAHKIESLNAYVACGHRHHGHAAAFLICNTCMSAQELHATQTLEALRQETQGVNFTLQNVVIEVRGLCSACRQSA